MVKSDLEFFILKFREPLHRYLQTYCKPVHWLVYELLLSMVRSLCGKKRENTQKILNKNQTFFDGEPNIIKYHYYERVLFPNILFEDNSLHLNQAKLSPWDWGPLTRFYLPKLTIYLIIIRSGNYDLKGSDLQF